MINFFIDSKYNPYTGYLTELNSDLQVSDRPLLVSYSRGEIYKKAGN